MKKGFTLIELLVVMAIIGILAAITIPALSGVKKAAHNAQCSNNIKQVAMATVNYSLEENDPTPAPSTPSGYRVVDIIPQQISFWSQIARYMGIKSADISGASETAVKTIIGNKRTALCPQLAKNNNVKKGISFGRNVSFSTGALAYYSNRSASPSKTCLIGNPGFNNNGFTVGMTTQFVHPASSTNVGFLDGHVENVLKSNFPETSTLLIPKGTGYLVDITFWTGVMPP